MVEYRTHSPVAVHIFAPPSGGCDDEPARGRHATYSTSAVATTQVTARRGDQTSVLKARRVSGSQHTQLCQPTREAVRSNRLAPEAGTAGNEQDQGGQQEDGCSQREHRTHSGDQTRGAQENQIGDPVRAMEFAIMMALCAHRG